MMRSILVPLDGSPFGEQALPLALGIARRARAGLHLAHVHLLPAPLFLEARPNVENTGDPGGRRRAHDYLLQAAERLRTAADVAVTVTVLEGGIAEALQDHVREAEIDLVVMTTHGRGPLSRFWLGSIAEELVRRAPVPVLLVRPQEAPPDPAREPVLENVIVPLDGSAFAEQILEPALALGGLYRARFTLVRVVPPIPWIASTTSEYLVGMAGQPPVENLWTETQRYVEHEKAEARQYLDHVAARLRDAGHQVETRVVVNQPPVAGVLEVARGQTAPLLALETHGRRGFSRLLLGSVADKVVRGAPGPVLVHRPRNGAV